MAYRYGCETCDKPAKHIVGKIERFACDDCLTQPEEARRWATWYVAPHPPRQIRVAETRAQERSDFVLYGESFYLSPAE